MSTILYHPETRPILENPLERARTRFDQAVALAQQLAAAERSWAMLGRLVGLIERDHDYERLGFDSMGSCIMEMEVLSGYSRASIYAFRKLYDEVSPGGGEHVLEMPFGSAQVFRLLPSQLQRDPQVREMAKRKPKVLRQEIAINHPEVHLEMREEIKLNVDESVYQLWREVIDGIRSLEGDPSMSHETVLEKMMADWLEWNRPRIQEKQNG